MRKNAMYILISGTARSGKSSYAEQRLEEFSSPKIYLAVSKIYDEDMRERVRHHRERRKNKDFITIEQTSNLAKVNIPNGANLLIESLTAWTANEMFTDYEVKSSKYVCKKILEDFMNLKDKCANIITVSDDVFSDGIVYDALTEEYIRTLAELTCKLATIADEVIECFAGLRIKYKISDKI